MHTPFVHGGEVEQADVVCGVRIGLDISAVGVYEKLGKEGVPHERAFEPMWPWYKQSLQRDGVTNGCRGLRSLFASAKSRGVPPHVP